VTALPAPDRSSLPRVSRRTLLVAGSALALAGTGAGRLLLRGADGSPSGLEALAAADGPRISMGFLDRAGDRGAPDLSGRPDVVPAGGVRPDRSLGRLATARIAGPTPGLLDDLPVAGLQLDALFEHPDGGEPLRHHAWSLSTDPLSVSPPIRFAAPIGVASLGFALQTSPATGEGRGATRVMTAAEDADLPGLRPGTYLLAVGEGVWDSPTRLPAEDDRAWADLASLVISILPR
jgi:hypothetical protein